MIFFQEYSCITPRLQQIERIEALDKTDASFNILGLIIFDAIGFVFFMTFFAIGSWKATQTQNMSPKLRQMQQRFIFQLCLQSLVPFAVVVVPMVVLVMAMLCDIFGFICKLIRKKTRDLLIFRDKRCCFLFRVAIQCHQCRYPLPYESNVSPLADEAFYEREDHVAQHIFCA